MPTTEKSGKKYNTIKTDRIVNRKVSNRIANAIGWAQHYGPAVENRILPSRLPIADDEKTEALETAAFTDEAVVVSMPLGQLIAPETIVAENAKRWRPALTMAEITDYAGDGDNYDPSHDPDNY